MKRTPALIGVLILAIIAALTYKLSLDHRQDVTNRTGPSIAIPFGNGTAQSPLISTRPAPGKKGVIYVASPNGGDDSDLVPQTITWTDSQSPAKDAVEALTKADNSPLPPGTALRGIKIADGLATVDLTRAFQTNFHGGDTQEAQTVNALLSTLGQFSDIDRVQILVEGKPIEALSQLPISGPLDVIRPDPIRQARNAVGHH